jgi:hypothetical protein
MNAKAKGSRNEYRTMRFLEKIGYSCTRAAASLGVFDVIAIGEAGVRCIQVKSNRWPGSAEMEAITLFRVPTGVTREIWRWDDHARYPLVKTV